mmetsp:Transcript_3221/g.7772  ORF Transcript_3221/g.7772 Transcript_3221/m.7772 type:complete len:85 (-) Transcript_3221:1517-1771(-)
MASSSSSELAWQEESPTHILFSMILHSLAGFGGANELRFEFRAKDGRPRIPQRSQHPFGAQHVCAMYRAVPYRTWAPSYHAKLQ